MFCSEASQYDINELCSYEWNHIQTRRQLHQSLGQDERKYVHAASSVNTRLKLKGYITRDQIRFMWYLIPRIIQKARDYNMKMIMETISSLFADGYGNDFSKYNWYFLDFFFNMPGG